MKKVKREVDSAHIKYIAQILIEHGILVEIDDHSAKLIAEDFLSIEVLTNERTIRG